MVKLSKFTKELLIAAISATISSTITGYFTFMAGKAQAADVSNITVHIDGQEQIVNADEIATLYTENMSLQESINNLNEELSNVNLKLQEESKAAESNQELAEKSQQNVANLQESIKTLQTENSDLRLENEKLTSEILTLKNASQINVPTEAMVQPVETVSNNEERAEGNSVLLCNLDYITGKRMYLHGTETDNMGQEQSNVISTCNNRFIINGEYSTITGTMFISEKQKNYGEPHIKIYGDDDILYDLQLEPGDQPVDFSVDISGVQQLDVKLYQNTYVSEFRLNK